MKILILLGLTCCCLTVSGQSTAAATNVRAMTEVERIGEATARHFFVFSTGFRNYTVRQDGRAEYYGSNAMRKNFDLKTGRGGVIDRLYFLEHGPDVLLLYEITDGRVGWAYMTLMDQRTAKPKWLTGVSAIDVGVPLVEDKNAYVTAANFVARIDLASGKYVWQLTDFAENQTAEFRLAELTADRVVLRQHVAQGRQIEINKESGQVMNQRVKVRN